jgi:hypothetical protein
MVLAPSKSFIFITKWKCVPIGLEVRLRTIIVYKKNTWRDIWEEIVMFLLFVGDIETWYRTFVVRSFQCNYGAGICGVSVMYRNGFCNNNDRIVSVNRNNDRRCGDRKKGRSGSSPGTPFF